jgi:uncharacterized protein YkwD
MTAQAYRTHPRSLAATLLLAIAVSALSMAGPSGAFACDNVEAKPSSTSLAKIEAATRCLVNKRRAKRDLKKLDGNGKLENAATRHSRDMEEHNYFSHTSLDGDSLVDRIRQTGYLSGSSNWVVGENIGWGSGSSATPRSMVKAWMNSSGHKDNILKPAFRDIGVGVARGAPRGGVGDAATYTTDFGKN